MENNHQPILKPGEVPIRLNPAKIKRGHKEHYLQLDFDLGQSILLVQVRLVDFNFITDEADVLVGNTIAPKNPPEKRIIL